MLRQLITPQSEVIRAIFLEDSPCGATAAFVGPQGRRAAPEVPRPIKANNHHGLRFMCAHTWTDLLMGGPNHLGLRFHVLAGERLRTRAADVGLPE